MGCDIEMYVESRGAGGWSRLTGDLFPEHHYDKNDPFDGIRNYGLYGFLADVRNYSHVPVIAEPRGLPDDVSPEVREEWYDGHSCSWLTVAELLAYDYDQIFWDRRVTKEISPGAFNGAALAEEGEGRHLTVREFLEDNVHFFRHLDELAALGEPADVRIVFWFNG